MAMTIEELIHAESGVARAFIGYLFAVLSTVAWPMIAASFGPEPSASFVVASAGLLVVQSGSRSIGLLVDECREFMMIPASTVHPPGEALAGIGARYIAGIATIAERMVVVLKVEELLNPAEPILAA